MDTTRYEDLKELYHAREEARSTGERENIEKTMYDIKEKQDDEDINNAREDLVKSVRGGDAKSTRKISEYIKVVSHKKGIEHNG